VAPLRHGSREGGTFPSAPSLPGPGKNRKMWETKGKRGERKSKVGEGGRAQTKQKKRTRKSLLVFGVLKSYLVLHCSRI